MGGTNASGQIPDIPNLPSLIDADTPDDIKTQTRTGFNGKQYQLVFSDEFNVDGRTFFPGDDPYVSVSVFTHPTDKANIARLDDVVLLPLKLGLTAHVPLFDPGFNWSTLPVFCNDPCRTIAVGSRRHSLLADERSRMVRS